MNLFLDLGPDPGQNIEDQNRSQLFPISSFSRSVLLSRQAWKDDKIIQLAKTLLCFVLEKLW